MALPLPVYPRLPFQGGAQVLAELPGAGYTVKWTPRFFVQSQKAASGAEIDLGLSAYPLHDFELTYPMLRSAYLPSSPSAQSSWSVPGSEMQWLMGLFLQMGGPTGRFFFTNPYDNFSRRQPLLSTTGGAALGLTSANSGDTYAIGRTIMGGGSNALDGHSRVYGGWEPIGAVDTDQYVFQPLGSTYLQLFLGDTYNATTGLWSGGSIVDFVSGSHAPTGFTLNTSTPVSQTVQLGSAYPGAGHGITADVAYLYYVKFADAANTFENFSQNYFELKKVLLRSMRKGPTLS